MVDILHKEYTINEDIHFSSHFSGIRRVYITIYQLFSCLHEPRAVLLPVQSSNRWFFSHATCFSQTESVRSKRFCISFESTVGAVCSVVSRALYARIVFHTYLRKFHLGVDVITFVLDQIFFKTIHLIS